MSNKPENKTVVIRVRVTVTEKSVLETLARLHGYKSVSDFTRAAWLMMMSSKPDRDPEHA